MNYSYEEAPYFSDEGIKVPIVCHLSTIKKPNWICPPHSHEYIEILYCTEGLFEIWLNGKYYKFASGDMVVINSHEIHTIRSIETGIYYVIRFLPEMIYAAGNSIFEAKYINPFIINNTKHQRVFKESEIRELDVEAKMKNMTREFSEKKYGYELALRTEISGIFLWILRYWNSNNVDLSIDTSVSADLLTKIQQVMDYIANNFPNDFTAADAAKMCNVSYSYFSRIFKQITKHSFSEYLTYIRITEAEKLLTSTDLSITEIAMQTGFSTSSYFISQFKAHKKISPKQFRKNILSSI